MHQSLKTRFNVDWMKVASDGVNGYQLCSFVMCNKQETYYFDQVDFWTEPRGSAPVDIHVPRKYVAVVKVYLREMR